MSRSKVLFILTGSIACFKACQLLSSLVQKGYEVQTVATKSALRFVGKATLEGITGKAVYIDSFEEGKVMDHIHLTREYDLALLCPATAKSLNHLAAGTMEGIVGDLFLAWPKDKPFLLAPAMNTSMWEHPITQRACSLLECLGIEILYPESGNLACGEKGQGRLRSIEYIEQHLDTLVSKTEEKIEKKHILLTAGGTKEPIDAVRAITNMSTGSTGAFLADSFSREGHEVTFLAASSAKLPESEEVKVLTFTSFQDLDKALQKVFLSRKFDAFIHLAAVSDYSLEEGSIVKGKISSLEPYLNLRLKRNVKLASKVRKEYGFQGTFVAFKLTIDASEKERLEAVGRLLHSSKADYVVHNDLGSAGKKGFTIMNQDKEGDFLPSKGELAKKLLTLINQKERV